IWTTSIVCQGRSTDAMENRQDDSSYSRDPHTNTRFRDYGSSHHEQERGQPSNPRGNWGHGRKAKQVGRGGRGRPVAKAEPPLVMSGIPHLEHSFVMNKKTGNAAVIGEEEATGERETESVCNAGADTPRMADENKGDLSSRDSERFSGERNENVCNTTVSEALTKCSNPADYTRTSNFGQDIQSRHNLVDNEATDTCGFSGNNSQVPEQMRVKEDVACESLEVTTYNSEKQQNVDRLLEEESGGSEPSLAPPHTHKLADPAKLELETERYYDELLGKEESEKKIAEKLSASQVAKITVSYKTDEEQKQAEEDRIQEEKQREQERKVQVETAWSILHQYWQFVRENPYDFNGWTYLMNHVENMDNLEAVRSAFDGFLPLYPYCFAYWKKLSDMELKHNEMKRSLGILLTGTECVPFCTDLWLSLLNNMITYVKQRDLPPHLVKELYQSGLDSMGGSWHSSSLWDACISYEQNNGDLITVMALYRRLIKTPTRLYNKHWDHFLALVRDHHPRNLLPAEEYQALRKQACEELKIKYTSTSLMPPKTIQKTPQPEDKLTSHLKEKVVALYIKTHECNEMQVDKRWKFEERIKRPYFHVKPLDKKQIKNWNDFLDFEISEGDPVRIIPLFERCLVACALYEDFWCRYATYMEKHVQNVMDGKFIEVANDEDKVNNENGKECKEDGESTEKSVSDSVEIIKEISSSGKVSEVNKMEESLDAVNTDEKVNGKSVDVESVENSDDSVVRGCRLSVESDFVRDSGVESIEKNDTATANDSVKADMKEQKQTGEKTDEKDNEVPAIEEDKNEGHVTDISKPLTLEQLKSELCCDLSITGRVLKCPPLTPQWIKSGVSWEDVRHIYRRGAWIHCPSKPCLLMQWAEFEETQGKQSDPGFSGQSGSSAAVSSLCLVCVSLLKGLAKWQLTLDHSIG
ncbi:Pre-mRNA-processing factor 39-like 1, partial [Homarus americanus]